MKSNPMADHNALSSQADLTQSAGAVEYRRVRPPQRVSWI